MRKSPNSLEPTNSVNKLQPLDWLALMIVLSVIGIFAIGCRDDLGADLTKEPVTWTIRVYRENGTLVEELKSFTRPSAYDSGKTVFRNRHGEIGSVLNPRGITVIIPDDPAS